MATRAPRLLVKGNIRKQCQRVVRDLRAILAYNGDHPEFSLDLLPAPYRANSVNLTIQLQKVLVKTG